MSGMLKRFEQPRCTSLLSITGTNTLRLSSKAFLKSKYPAFKGWGTNLQNIEHWLQIIFWADKGYKFVQADQAGAEALITAYLCRKGRLRDLFIYGVKPHVFVAMHNFLDIWKIKLPHIDIEVFTKTSIGDLRKNPDWPTLDNLIKASDHWPAEERYYFIAKMFCHASNYGITPNELRLNILKKSDGVIVLTKQQSAKYLANYHELFPELHEWHFEVEEVVKKYKMLYNLQGDPLTCVGQITPRYLKECFARVPQSTVGVITHDAIVDMCRFVNNEHLDWHLLNNKHDSYMMMVPEAEVEDCAVKMVETLSRELQAPDGTLFKMKAEVHIGNNWAPYDKERNPEGMKEVSTNNDNN